MNVGLDEIAVPEVIDYFRIYEIVWFARL